MRKRGNCERKTDRRSLLRQPPSIWLRELRLCKSLLIETGWHGNTWKFWPQLADTLHSINANLTLELHVPCRDPVQHLMSYCNHKHKVFDCHQNHTTETLLKEYHKCVNTEWGRVLIQPCWPFLVAEPQSALKLSLLQSMSTTCGVICNPKELALRKSTFTEIPTRSATRMKSAFGKTIVFKHNSEKS